MPSGASSVPDPVLQAHGLSLSYPRADRTVEWILQDFSLTLHAGELVSLLGPSGVGKSSLLRVLAGLQLPARGAVCLFGQAMRGAHPRAALVFQQAALLPWLNVRDNVAFGLDFRHQPALSREQIRQRVDEALHEVGLMASARASVGALSGGMAQRVALARAWARRPGLLLLDEPFSALDEVTRADMQTLLRRLVSEQGAAAVLVTHDFDEALTVSDRVLLIGNRPGRLMGEWVLTEPHPRVDAALKMHAQRLEMLQLLRDSRLYRQQLDTVEYVI